MNLKENENNENQSDIVEDNSKNNDNQKIELQNNNVNNNNNNDINDNQYQQQQYQQQQYQQQQYQQQQQIYGQQQLYNQNPQNVKKTYFKIDDGNVIYAASTGRRFLARLLDWIFALAITFLIVTIYTPVAFNDITQIPTQYDPVYMTAWILAIIGLLFVSIIYPLLINKKNIGQSPGKKIMKITPIFLNDKNDYVTFLLRESMITGLILLPLIFQVMIGLDGELYFAKYNAIANDVGNETIIPYVSNYYDFVINYWGNPDTVAYWNTLGYTFPVIGTYEVVFLVMCRAITTLYWIVFLILFVTVFAGFQKRGFHDKATNTAIVDLRTIISEKEAEERIQSIYTNTVQQNVDIQPTNINPSNPIIINDENTTINDNNDTTINDNNDVVEENDKKATDDSNNLDDLDNNKELLENNILIINEEQMNVEFDNYEPEIEKPLLLENNKIIDVENNLEDETIVEDFKNPNLNEIESLLKTLNNDAPKEFLNIKISEIKGIGGKNQKYFNDNKIFVIYDFIIAMEKGDLEIIVNNIPGVKNESFDKKIIKMEVFIKNAKLLLEQKNQESIPSVSDSFANYKG